MLAIDNDGEVRVMRNAATVLAIIHYEHWRAGCPESGHVRFGGGPSEKDQHRWYLAGGLPYARAWAPSCSPGHKIGQRDPASTHCDGTCGELTSNSRTTTGPSAGDTFALSTSPVDGQAHCSRFQQDVSLISPTA